MTYLRLALIAVGGAILAACGGDVSAPALPSPTGTVAAPSPSLSPSPEPAALTPSPTGTPAFEGTRGPVEKPPGGDSLVAILIDVRVGTHEGFDRIVFEFEGGLPGYRIEYVEAPLVHCGSGLPVEITGHAFLQASFSPAAGHDVSTGESTFDPTELAPGLPTLGEAERTCDFEGLLAWVLGLSEEVDYRIAELEDPYRLAIDVRHP